MEVGFNWCQGSVEKVYVRNQTVTNRNRKQQRQLQIQVCLHPTSFIFSCALNWSPREARYRDIAKKEENIVSSNPNGCSILTSSLASGSTGGNRSGTQATLL